MTNRMSVGNSFAGVNSREIFRSGMGLDRGHPKGFKPLDSPQGL